MKLLIFFTHTFALLPLSESVFIELLVVSLQKPLNLSNFVKMETIESNFEIDQSLINFKHVLEILSQTFIKHVICNIQAKQGLVSAQCIDEVVLDS